MFSMKSAVIGIAICEVAIPLAALAESLGPHVSTPLRPIEVPKDRPYPGEIQLTVNATDLERRIVHVHESVSGVGPETALLYPKWRQQALDQLALHAATYEHQAGRQWRPLQDTTNDPIINERRSQSWRDWQRYYDYYREGALVWLDADTLIRERSQNKRSLDDFARAFFGINDGSLTTVTYTFDDVVKTLNAVEPHGAA